MPVIHTYDQQYRSQGDPGRNVQVGWAGIHAAGSVGEATQQFGQSVGVLGQGVEIAAERSDRSDLQAAAAKARADITTQLQNDVQSGAITADDYTQKFNDLMSQRLNGLGANMRTRAGREAASVTGAQLGAEFTEHVNQAQIVANGQKAATNYAQTVDDNSRTLYADPTQLTPILQSMQVSLNDPSGPYAKMSAQQKADAWQKTSSTLAVSALRGIIQNGDPAFAKAEIQKGSGSEFAKYLNGEQSAVLSGMADTAIRAKEVEQLRLQAQKEKELALAREQAMEGFVGKMFAPQGNTLSVNDVLKSNLSAAQQEHFIGMIQAAATRELKDNPSTMQDLFNRIHLPDGDPNKITSETQLYPYYGHGLGNTGLGFLRGELKDTKDPNNESLNAVRTQFLSSVKSQITNSTGFMKDAKGDAQYYQFQQWVRAKELETRQAGGDVFSLYDPRSKNYIGGNETLQMFGRTPQEVIQDQAAAIARAQGGSRSVVWPGANKTNVAPRKPGETIDAYLKRVQAAKPIPEANTVPLINDAAKQLLQQ